MTFDGFGRGAATLSHRREARAQLAAMRTPRPRGCADAPRSDSSVSPSTYSMRNGCRSLRLRPTRRRSGARPGARASLSSILSLCGLVAPRRTWRDRGPSSGRRRGIRPCRRPSGATIRNLSATMGLEKRASPGVGWKAFGRWGAVLYGGENNTPTPHGVGVQAGSRVTAWFWSRAGARRLADGRYFRSNHPFPVIPLPAVLVLLGTASPTGSASRAAPWLSAPCSVTLLLPVDRRRSVKPEVQYAHSSARSWTFNKIDTASASVDIGVQRTSAPSIQSDAAS